MMMNLKLTQLNLNFLFTSFLVIVLSTASARADTIELLQKNASVAYEKMMDAKQNADTAAKDAAFAEKKLASAKQKMAKAEREAEAAQKKSEQAKIAAEQATNRWKQASDTLANEWGKSEVK
ncbi:hypothetical protein [Nitrosomonas sp.]|uniref:hypothetical protein n=1 Tax=Nitrosomonas sp. TaxID=42353 RepID=UPI0025F54782|nr:hypothetical protein [Nitrosomonas sp.]